MHFINLNVIFSTLPINIQHHPYRTLKTSKLVEPAEMNGSGKPVGGQMVDNKIF